MSLVQKPCGGLPKLILTATIFELLTTRFQKTNNDFFLLQKAAIANWRKFLELLCWRLLDNIVVGAVQKKRGGEVVAAMITAIRFLWKKVSIGGGNCNRCSSPG